MVDADLDQLSEPLVQPLPTEQDEADLFNSKTDLLDTKVRRGSNKSTGYYAPME